MKFRDVERRFQEEESDIGERKKGSEKHLKWMVKRKEVTGKKRRRMEELGDTESD